MKRYTYNAYVPDTVRAEGSRGDIERFEGPNEGTKGI